MQTSLVIDDSPIELLMTKTLLERLGHSPLTATNGRDALKLIREYMPDLVICDINMPGMSGQDVLEESRHLPVPPMFIMATGLNDAESAVTSLQHGAYGYLTKPLKEDSLRSALEEANRRRQKEVDACRERERLVKTDQLTGLLNKDEFLNELTRLSTRQAIDDIHLAIFFINVDGMRYVNNTYGHHEGDRVLKHVAGLLKQSLRPKDLVARYGGDVFAIALIGIDQEHAENRANEMSARIEQARITLSNRDHSLTVSIGAALGFASAGADVLVNNADFSLALAKDKGRNQIHFFRDGDEDLRKKYGDLFMSLETLREAIKERRFNMYFQPIVALNGSGKSHYEELIRLRDKEDKLLPPDVFIRVAERFGLASKIDCMVVTACIEKLAQLAKVGNESGMGINLSGQSVGSIELLNLIKSLLAEHKEVDPSRIVFEITETAVFHNLELVQDFVRDVKRLGCQFALDDFGVGFSSFYYIKKLDIDCLKIDGSFIKNIRNSLNDRVFVQAMVEISRVFGMKVVAEWVEDAETVSLLKSLGVDSAQGYYFGKPAPDLEQPRQP